MGLRINTNVASLTAQRNMQAVTGRLQRSYAHLSSGLRIATAADDAAGLAISERMRSQIRSLAVAGRNAMDGISLSQTAEGALNEVSNILNRLRELHVQAANGTMSADDRTTIGEEVTQLTEEITRIADSTEFNGISLLNSTASTAIQVGIDSGDTIDVQLQDVQLAALGIAALDVSDATAASAGLALLDDAINTINSTRGNLGAAENRLTSAFTSIQNVRENLSAAESRIRDVDVASETAELTRNSIMQQAAVSVLQQANVQPQVALSLLQG